MLRGENPLRTNKLQIVLRPLLAARLLTISLPAVAKKAALRPSDILFSPKRLMLRKISHTK
jgi:hypothetical protein